MTGIASFYQRSIGKKVVMALTGAFLLFYVVVHMWGNFKIFLGQEQLDHYAEGLKTLGDPLFAEEQVLWLFRIALLAAFLLHIYTAMQLSHMASRGRPVAYKQRKDVQANFASRMMLLGGIAVLLFVIYHLMHFTIGVAHSDFVYGEVFNNVVRGFQEFMGIPAIIYIIAMIFLSMHIYHGAWSIFQTLGLNGPQYNGVLRGLATLIAVVVAIGNISIPLYALFALSPVEVTGWFQSIAGLFGF
ncbi:MAG: succinate dehydrogenase cytochrome b subunit [Chloroflexaceae bacterium]|nr:succinate dehydrogenase cytochrome b subunit [Chloroflexaceae bacterium]